MAQIAYVRFRKWFDRDGWLIGELGWGVKRRWLGNPIDGGDRFGKVVCVVEVCPPDGSGPAGEIDLPDEEEEEER